MKKFIIITLLFLCAQAAEARDISVLIRQDVRQCSVAGTSYYITVADGGVTPEITGTFSLYANGASLSAGSVSYAMPATVSSRNPITIDGKSYRGKIVFESGCGGFNIVNVVDMEEYLKGVLKDEMSPAWPAEALKAQAVLARTFASGSKKHGRYDVCDKVHCQSYSGTKGESAAIVDAVNATGGEILKYGGAPAEIYYFAESGGCTASAKSAWNKNLPYLSAKPDPVPVNGPNAKWQAAFTMQQIASRLAAAGVPVGSISSLAPAGRDESGRVTSIEVTGSGGTNVVAAAKFRAALGASVVKSTLFEFSAAGGYTPQLKATPATAEPKPQYRAPTAKADVATMPEKDEEILYWMARNKIFTIQELVSMIGKDSEYPKFIAEGKRRMAARGQTEPPQQGAAARQPAVAPQADASPLSNAAASGYSVTIYGRGFGHGVGMPQWTAKALAENGWSYKQILDYYFPGTSLEKDCY